MAAVSGGAAWAQGQRQRSGAFLLADFVCCHASLSSAAQALHLHLLCQVGRVGEEQGGMYAVLLNLVQWPVQWIVQLGPLR